MTLHVNSTIAPTKNRSELGSLRILSNELDVDSFAGDHSDKEDFGF